MAYIFKITIDFQDNHKPLIQLYDGISSYRDNLHDTVRITNKSVCLECRRSKDRELTKLLTDFNSTINLQITKVFCYLAMTYGTIPPINNITLEKFDLHQNLVESRIIDQNDIQPIYCTVPNEYIITDNSLVGMFTHSEKTDAMLKALVFWLRAINTNIPENRFEKLWMSFNCLYSYIGRNETNEMKKHIKMKKFIWDNKDLFPKSCSRFEEYGVDQIRELRWRELILNDYDNFNKTKSYLEFVKRYSDCRLIEILNRVRVYRQDYMERADYLEDHDKHIQKKLAENKMYNHEVLTFYLIKYSYFIRNKYFHGEKIRPSFHLLKSSLENQELQLLNNILMLFVFEMISNMDTI